MLMPKALRRQVLTQRLGGEEDGVNNEGKSRLTSCQLLTIFVVTTCSAPLCAFCCLQRISNLKFCIRRGQQLAIHPARGHPPYLQNSVTYQSLLLNCCWIWECTRCLQARKCTPTSRAIKQASKLRQGSGKPER